jgi:hypothetical protein
MRSQADHPNLGVFRIYVGRLLQRAALRRGTEELEKRVRKGILPPSKRPPEGEEEASPPPARAPEQGLEEQLLRKGLEKFFGR